MAVYNFVQCPKCQSINWEKLEGDSSDFESDDDYFQCKDCGNKFQFKQEDEDIGKPPGCPFSYCPHQKKIEELLKFKEEFEKSAKEFTEYIKEQEKINSGNEVARVMHTKFA